MNYNPIETDAGDTSFNVSKFVDQIEQLEDANDMHHSLFQLPKFEQEDE